jgi:uncharacterized protein YhhL (DUF1145 family)
VTAPAAAPRPATPTGPDSHRALGFAIAGSLAFSALIWAANANLAGWTLATQQAGAPRLYPWQLAESTTAGRVTAWGGYALHQLTIWWLIWKAQASKLRYTSGLKPINLAAFGATAFFVLLHFVQTQLFYDGLAQDVPEWTAMWSVILLLLIVILIENRRRGITFGIPWGGYVREAGDVARRYHGYYFAWATVYTFWYHPTVFTSGHALGFLYMFLLFTQGSLFYTRAHLNRWWTVTLEVLVMVHGVMVALMNVDGMWHMFGFGLLGIFIVTQSFGLGWRRATSLTLVGLYAGLILAFYSQWGWQDLPRVFRILGGYYVALPVLAAILFLLGRTLLRERAAPRDGSAGRPAADATR